jgi:hypothetical protein
MGVLESIGHLWAPQRRVQAVHSAMVPFPILTSLHTEIGKDIWMAAHAFMAGPMPTVDARAQALLSGRHRF